MKAENGGKQMRDVWDLPRTGEEELTADGAGRMWTQIAPRREEKAFGSHPTQKPVALLERIIEASTPEDAAGPGPVQRQRHHGRGRAEAGPALRGHRSGPKYLELTKKRLDAVSR